MHEIETDELRPDPASAGIGFLIRELAEPRAGTAPRRAAPMPDKFLSEMARPGTPAAGVRFRMNN
jgi:hypothetical protein